MSVNYWKACEYLTAHEAAMLIVSVDPDSAEWEGCEGWKPREQPSGYPAILRAIMRAVDSGALAARAVHSASRRFVAGLDLLDPRYGGDGDCFEFIESTGEQFVVRSKRDWTATTIDVGDLRAWLTARGMRPVFFFPDDGGADAAPVASPVHAHPAGPRWPWGDHETELLRSLAAAAKRFWTRYDPSDPTTAPKNEDVANWLQNERRASARNAEIMAQILRADGLKPGPRG
ncbi:MAG: hypothetical protein KAX84_11745 [Burkholderiales bacterium]|nr:hypothetical protein [Burkholderiales bacterium]